MKQHRHESTIIPRAYRCALCGTEYLASPREAHGNVCPRCVAAPAAHASPPARGPEAPQRELLRIVATAHGITQEQLQRPGGTQQVSRAKDIALALLRRLWPSLSSRDLQEYFAVDDSTIRHRMRRPLELAEEEVAAWVRATWGTRPPPGLAPARDAAP